MTESKEKQTIWERLDNLKPMKINSVISIRKLNWLIILFQILSLTLVMFHGEEGITLNKLLFSISLIGLVMISNAIVQKITKGDPYIMLIVTMLFSIGIIMIYRLNAQDGIRQIIWFIIGIVAFYGTYFLLRIIKGWEKWTFFYIGICLLLFFVTLVFGVEKYGAKNWIDIAGMSFQPSEITKIVFCFLIGSFYVNYERFTKYYLGKYFLMAVVYFFIGLLFIQKDLGTAVIFYGVFFISQYIYEEDKRLLLANLGLAIVGFVMGYILFDHVKIRVATWLNPWETIDSTGYQITQALFAIASGGFFGTGIGMGRPDFIPLPHSDFIFASICEEMGIFIGMGVVMLILILVYRGFKIALEQKDTFFKIISMCITSVFAIQALIMFGGVLKLIPLTGVTIPFVAYGGTSLLSSFISLAVLQYASEEIKPKEESNG